MTARLSCYSCGTATADTRSTHCACGEPLWFDIDTGAFEWPEADDRSGPWRYASVLPVADRVDIGSAAGDTPLFRVRKTSEDVGCTLYLKYEGQNPTGSFKDRGTAVGVSRAVASGDRWVGTVSHGNMALSVSAYAASAGLHCAVFVPADTPEERLRLIGRHDPAVFRVDGDYGRLYELTSTMRTNMRFLNSDAPLRVAGQKTIAYEICEAFAPDVPDAVVLPVSSGGNASAVWKALRELRAAGVIERVPRIYLVQAAACDPVASAYRDGAESVTQVEPEPTVATSIANADPPSGTRALAAVRSTGGSVVAVSDEAIRDGMARLATAEGLSVEPSCATVIPAVRELVDSGELTRDEEVVAILTGSGYKERYDGESACSRTVTLDDVEETITDLVSGS